MILNKIKILVVHGKGGCDFWRTYQPCEEMRKQGLADVHYLEARFMNGKQLAKEMHDCDIAIIRGLIGPEGLDTLRRYKALGVKIVTDYDDLHFNVSPFNPAYKNFGTEEIEVKDPATGDIKYLWKDGVEGFDLKKNKVTFHSYKAILQECDLITTPTVYLKNALAELSGRNDNIRVVPNAVDFTQWKPLSLNGDKDIRSLYKDNFRFGWTVSNSHGEDWIHIKSSLVDFLKSHQDATFVCLGDTSINIKSALPKDQVEWYPFSDLWEGHYPMRMAMLGLDVAIAPLASTEFNRCKSPLKYAEYTAFGWPVIAQNMEPYSSHIINGDTGLLASDKDSWIRCLESLYANKDLRSKLHFNALFAVKSMFDLSEVAKEWHKIYTDYITGEVLTNE